MLYYLPLERVYYYGVPSNLFGIRASIKAGQISSLLLVDGGAMRTSLSPDLINSLQIAAIPGSTVRVGGIGGTVETWLYRLDRFLLAPANSGFIAPLGERPEVPSITVPLGLEVAGILGMDVLTRYGGYYLNSSVPCLLLGIDSILQPVISLLQRPMIQ